MALGLMYLPFEIFEAPYQPLDGFAGLKDGNLAVYGRALARAESGRLEGISSAWISGCPESACAVVGRMKSLRRLVIFGWAMPDLSLLSELHGLEALGITDSPNLKSLAGLERLVNLRELYLTSNMGISEVSQVKALKNLKTLCLEGGFSKPLHLDTLAPLSSLSGVERLRLASIRVRDKSLRPLVEMTSLQEVFVAKTFPKSELRFVAAHRPDVHGEFLDSFRSEA